MENIEQAVATLIIACAPVKQKIKNINDHL